jgi:ABC-type glutathione transport system ATPase component
MRPEHRILGDCREQPELVRGEGELHLSDRRRRQVHCLPAGTRSATMESASGAMRNPVDAPSLEVREVAKTYPLGAAEVVALDHLSLTIAHGEFAAIVGRSGSGKTTLLNLFAGIDRPSSGTVRVAGADLGGLSESELAAWRGESVGLVFQFFQLLPTLTVIENVMLPMDFAKKIPGARRALRPFDRIMSPLL